MKNNTHLNKPGNLQRPGVSPIWSADRCKP